MQSHKRRQARCKFPFRGRVLRGGAPPVEKISVLIGKRLTGEGLDKKEIYRNA